MAATRAYEQSLPTVDESKPVEYIDASRLHDISIQRLKESQAMSMIAEDHHHDDDEEDVICMDDDALSVPPGSVNKVLNMEEGPDQIQETRLKLKALRLSRLCDIETGLAECVLLVRLVRYKQAEIGPVSLQSIYSSLQNIERTLARYSD